MLCSGAAYAGIAIALLLLFAGLSACCRALCRMRRCVMWALTPRFIWCSCQSRELVTCLCCLHREQVMMKYRKMDQQPAERRAEVSPQKRPVRRQEITSGGNNCKSSFCAVCLSKSEIIGFSLRGGQRVIAEPFCCSVDLIWDLITPGELEVYQERKTKGIFIL